MIDYLKYKLDSTPQNWIVLASNKLLNDDIREDEGSLEYQTKIKTFKNGKFQVYKDSLGYDTIGYGHLLREGEQFKTGIIESAANDLLAKDLTEHVQNAKKLFDQYKMKLPELAQIILVEMVFQLGIGTASKFKNTLSALAKNDYLTAALGMKNSAWYKQTPNRVQKHITRLENLAKGIN